jgi:carboxymethylenebutenolidase
MIDRRAVLSGLAVLALYRPARATTPEQFSAADREGKRPVVLLLHGSRGFERKPLAYERYAAALAAKGIDACLLRYFTAADAPMFDPKTTRDMREAYETTRFDAWSKRVSAAVSAMLARPDCSGRIGLLGFSLGGYVAANTAARDPRIAALAVLYGGMPDATVSRVRHLPPLIELHGEADRNVPIARGQELVKLGKAVGAEAEFVGYPGKGHGFDFSDADPVTVDAIGRVVAFFEARLNPN